MAKCAQLAQIVKDFYKVFGEGDDKYLIATAEQPLCAYHMDEWIHPRELPIRCIDITLFGPEMLVTRPVLEKKLAPMEAIHLGYFSCFTSLRKLNSFASLVRYLTKSLCPVPTVQTTKLVDLRSGTVRKR
ncbi:unnamed protein product [Eruca vesicaria subsp. sativa]|uniref:Uncharacterized protein n=1 Tax=Eruca vesicaria subsp. sativa TaxID=29727 RepID=A0ABC8LEP3_ERUVS|nr:unnamed protein product [Eruca vesicaria subsp. sativa]